MFPTSAPFNLGDVIAAGYRIDSLLGRGGVANVYRATRISDGVAVAVKRLDPTTAVQPLVRERFEREIEMLTRLRHKSIVAMLDDFTLGETERCLVLEFVEGITLAECMETDAPLPPQRAAHIAEDVLDALAAAHIAGVVHRDVKPDNVLLSNKGHAVLTDFGVASWMDAVRNADLTPPLTVMGTPRYAAPEQIRGETTCSPRADQFSLGVVLYEMLTAQSPFDDGAATPTPMRAHTEGVPPSLEAVVMRALAPLAKDRFDSCAEMRKQLQSSMTSKDVLT